MIYIFDIDGTLADISHRLHHIQKEPKDWSGFFADCGNDVPIPGVVAITHNLRRAGAFILLVTGRSDEIRALTQNWLTQMGVHHKGLYMRKAGDHREDHVIKAEILERIREEWHQEPIAGIFEDRNQVVKMYRAQGLTVFQVADGDF